MKVTLPSFSTDATPTRESESEAYVAFIFPGKGNPPPTGGERFPFTHLWSCVGASSSAPHTASSGGCRRAVGDLDGVTVPDGRCRCRWTVTATVTAGG